MNPTTKLRFVERVTHRTQWGWQTEKVLQQWWQGEQIGEWRDVPTEQEEGPR